MRYVVGLVKMMTLGLWAEAAAAQSWVQVEAQPSEAQALERAESYANRLSDVNAFKTGSQWHVIALGPYDEIEAQTQLLQLRQSRQVPPDAFISDGRSFGERIFGEGRSVATLTQPSEPAEPLIAGEETPEEARAGERNLTREDRALIQTAMKLDGFYTARVDASFGPGTRRAMSAWQQANGYEPTGILTTLQRRALIDGYFEVLQSLDLAPVIDANAGIEIEMPTGIVSFDRYESPFAHYTPTTDEGVRVLLISQSGDGATLAALYDIMQTLEIVPLNGSRALRQNSFTLEGANDRIVSHTYARIDGETVKGYTLVWPAGDEKRFRLALDAMQTSFTTTEAVLPDTAGNSTQNIDLLSGLEIRRADRSSSGFFIDRTGAVLTTRAAVNQCTRITLNDESDAEIAAEDSALGLVLLKPLETLAPLSVARLAASEPRLQSDIAIAGYSFGGVLTAPSLTYGTLSDLKGLDGDTRVQRLSVTNEPGDAGGPVFNDAGGVLGMLLDREESARQLPGDVAFAADAPVLADFLTTHGVTPDATDAADTLPPEDLTLLAADMTVLVSCWN